MPKTITLTDEQVEVLKTGLQDLIEIDQNALKQDLGDKDVQDIDWHATLCRQILFLLD